MHMDLFNNEHSIVIKIDYTDAERIGLDHLKARIGVKSIRIVKDKYFAQDKFSINDLEDYLFRSNLSENLKKQLIYYCNGKITDIVSTDENSMMVYEMFKTLKLFLLEKYNNRFIFIIDGLDNFHRDISNKKAFKQRISELANFLTSDEIDDCSYLIVMRKESYWDLKKIAHSGRIQRSEWGNVSLFPVDFNRILNSKFEFLEYLLQEPVTDAQSQDDSENITKAKLTFSRLCRKFSTFMLSYIQAGISTTEDSVNDYTFQTLSKTNRGLMNALKTIITDLLSQIEISSNAKNHEDVIKYLESLLNNEDESRRFIRRFKWLVLRSLMLNRFYYCLEPFEYKIDKESIPGEISIGPNVTHDCDSRSLLTNLFHFLDPESYKRELGSSTDPYKYHYLIKIRILQYFYFINEKKINGSYESASLFLSHVFGYKKQWIIYECRLLYANLCLEKIIPTENINNEISVSITDYGKFLIKKMIFNYSYLENTLDNAVVEKEYCRKHLSPSITIAKQQQLAITKPDEFKYVFGKALAEKIIRVIAFVAYIEKIESLERQEITSIANRIEQNIDLDEFMDDTFISTPMKKSVFTTITRFTNSNSPFIQRFVNHQLETIITEQLEIDIIN